MVWMAKRPRSQAIQRRLSFSAAIADEPEPTKQSKTRSPGFDAIESTRSMRSTGFWVW